MIEIEKFRDLTQNQRQDRIKNKFEFSDSDISNLKNGGIDISFAEKLIENSIGIYGLPLGIATNFRINGIDRLIPMVTEEPSIIAAASKAAKIFKEFGGITATSDEPIAIGQIQLIAENGENVSEVVEIINKNKDMFIETANSNIPSLLARGGGVTEIETRVIQTKKGILQVIVHSLINTKDAMGANIVNTVCENMAPIIAQKTQTRVGLKILSNLTDKRMAKAEVSIILPHEIMERIVEAQEFAENDIYRAATHNKGIFNGIDSVALATGNDWRAIEAGAHAYASIKGKYSPLTSWEIQDEKLVGKIELPLQVGTVGGLTKLHPIARMSLKIMNIKSSKDLAETMAAVGLAQNFAAINALVTTGIQAGHMKLHKRREDIT